MTAMEIIKQVYPDGEDMNTDFRTKLSMKIACWNLWSAFHLGTEAEFELWWRFNMEG